MKRKTKAEPKKKQAAAKPKKAERPEVPTHLGIGSGRGAVSACGLSLRNELRLAQKEGRGVSFAADEIWRELPREKRCKACDRAAKPKAQPRAKPPTGPLHLFTAIYNDPAQAPDPRLPWATACGKSVPSNEGLVLEEQWRALPAKKRCAACIVASVADRQEHELTVEEVFGRRMHLDSLGDYTIHQFGISTPIAAFRRKEDADTFVEASRLREEIRELRKPTGPVMDEIRASLASVKLEGFNTDADLVGGVRRVCTTLAEVRTALEIQKQAISRAYALIDEGEYEKAQEALNRAP